VDRSARVEMNNTSNVVPGSGWFIFIGTVDTEAGVMKLWIGDTDISVALGVNDSPFSMAFNGKSFSLMDDGFGDFITGDMADFQYWVGVSLLSAGNISEATRRLFVDGNGKPVNPSTAAATLGQQTILFSGNASQFPTNQGTGGAFSLTGTLTNASSHP
jgi:hypothetical protein